MTGRMPKRSRWRWSLALWIALGTGHLGTGTLFAQAPTPDRPPSLPPASAEISLIQPPAQDKAPAPDKPPPVLPPTTVTGDQPQAPGEGTFPSADFGPATAPLSAGGMFASPSADGYFAPSATTGTIIDVPQIDFPGTVSVVPNYLLRDQQALNVENILRDITSAVKLGDFRSPDAFTVRGFEVRPRDYRWNGFLDPSSAPRDFANIQRFDFLQGPASVLYGSGQPAGVVNVITKKPQADPFTYADVQFGSFGFFRTTADSTGPVDADGRLLYRINFAYENHDSFRDFGFGERTFVAPAFTYILDEDTAISFEFQYLNDRRRLDTGVVALNGQANALPINRFLGEPTDFQHYNDYKTSIMLTHRFNDDWAGRIGFYSTWYDNPSYGTVPIDLSLLPGFVLPPNTVARQIQNTPDFREQYYSIVGDIGGKFQTGPIKHTAVAGMELGWFNSTDFTTLLSDPAQLTFIPPSTFFLSPTSPINVVNPVYGTPQPPTPGKFDADFTQERYGFYLQDLMELTPHWKLLAGVRYDVAITSFARELNDPVAGFPTGFPRVETDANYYRLTPRVGVIYQPIPEVLSFYGTFSESFDPPPGGNFRNPEPLVPETGQSYEVGFKANMLDKHLSLSAAGFYITKDNVVTQDSFFFAQQIGEQLSQGAEVSLVGKLTDNWSILANYAYIDSRIISDPVPTLVGNRFRGVPYNSANLWTRYNLVQNDAHTIGLALGVVYVGNRVGDLADTFQLPGYTRWDAGVYYQRRNLLASVYMENIFDRQYYTGSLDSMSVYPGAPFNVRAQIGVKY